jgi:hypothetical protein
MKTLIAFCMLALFIPFLQGQTFNGKLTYYVETDTGNLRMLREVADKFGSIGDYYKLREEIVLIGNEAIMSKSVADNGIVKSMNVQNCDSAHVLLFGERTSKLNYNAPILGNDKHKQVFVEKTKEAKYILGFLCRKHIYKSEGIEGMTIAWIPDNFLFTKQHKNGKFFSGFFFPHGLVFEKEMIYKNQVNRRTLIKMEIFDVTEEIINDFTKTDK